jgi:hypothetical protein
MYLVSLFFRRKEGFMENWNRLPKGAFCAITDSGATYRFGEVREDGTRIYFASFGQEEEFVCKLEQLAIGEPLVILGPIGRRPLLTTNNIARIHVDESVTSVVA